MPKYVKSVSFSARSPIIGFRYSSPAFAALLNAAFIFVMRPDVVSAISPITPDMEATSPAIPLEPSLMPLVRISIPSFAGTRPPEIIFCISSVVTPYSLARIVRPCTPPTARELMVSMLILPDAAAWPKASAIEFRASSPLPDADAASPRLVTMPATFSASTPKAIRFLPAPAHASKEYGVP